MTTLASFSALTPSKPAVIYGGGEFVETYDELERRSRRIASALRDLGLDHGDCVAVLLANDDEFFDIYWACHRDASYGTAIGLNPTASASSRQRISHTNYEE